MFLAILLFRVNIRELSPFCLLGVDKMENIQYNQRLCSSIIGGKPCVLAQTQFFNIEGEL